MIWAIRIPLGKDVKFQTSSDESQIISLASLDCRQTENLSDDLEKTRRSSLLIKSNDIFTVLCTLDKYTVPQQKLDLILGGGEHIILRVEGRGILYLTGYGSRYPTTETVPGSVTDATTNERSEEMVGEGTGSEEESTAMDEERISVPETSASSSPKSIIESHQEEKSDKDWLPESTESEDESPIYTEPSTSTHGMRHSVKQAVAESNTLNRMKESYRRRTRQSVSPGNVGPDDTAIFSKNKNRPLEQQLQMITPKRRKDPVFDPVKIQHLITTGSVTDATTNKRSKESVGEGAGLEEESTAMDEECTSVPETSTSSLSPKSVIENHTEEEEQFDKDWLPESAASEDESPIYAEPSTSTRGLSHSVKQGVSEDNTLNRMKECNRRRTRQSVSPGNASSGATASYSKSNNQLREQQLQMVTPKRRKYQVFDHNLHDNLNANVAGSHQDEFEDFLEQSNDEQMSPLVHTDPESTRCSSEEETSLSKRDNGVHENRSEHEHDTGPATGSPRAAIQPKDLLKRLKRVPLSACVFCSQNEDDEFKFGKFYKVNLGSEERKVHHNCLRSKEKEGIQAFHPDDILAELNRAKLLKCRYCTKTGASIGCGVTRCKQTYHFPCGREHQAIFQFYAEYVSLCSNHRPTQKLPEKVAPLSTLASCPVCSKEVPNAPGFQVLVTPCCGNTFLHRYCIEKLASSLGYVFQCPVCGNREEFQREMLKLGINVRLKDESAYQDLLGLRPKSCEQFECLCPKGREHSTKQGDWQILMCTLCDKVGCHRRCGDLQRTSKDWTCPDCREVGSEPPPDSSPRVNNGVITGHPINRSLSQDTSGGVTVSANDSSPQGIGDVITGPSKDRSPEDTSDVRTDHHPLDPIVVITGPQINRSPQDVDVDTIIQGRSEEVVQDRIHMPGSSPIRWKYCNKAISSKIEYKNHLRTHRPDIGITRAVSKTGISSSQQMNFHHSKTKIDMRLVNRCQFCGKKFVHMKAVENHQKNCRRGSGK